LFAVLERLGAIGFQGVEFLSFFGRSAEDVRRKMEELNMSAVGNHVGFAELVSDTNGVIEYHRKVGCRFITVGNIPADGLPGGNSFKDTVKQLVQIGNACRMQGITLLYHNHAAELGEKLDGKHMLEVLLDEVPDECLSLEPDLGWMAIAGADPVFFLEKYKTRCPVIHLKDFYASDTAKIGNVMDLNGKRGSAERGCFEFRPVGYGIANIPQYIDKVLACSPEWIVMDHDLAYERDSFEDLKMSLEYTRQLLAIT
jgi:sugar phosphate isomerase/epimerase